MGVLSLEAGDKEETLSMEWNDCNIIILEISKNNGVLHTVEYLNQRLENR